jgi:hypothetical protein
VTASASARPWFSGLPFYTVEDQIHSFAATAMGFAFARALVEEESKGTKSAVHQQKVQGPSNELPGFRRTGLKFSDRSAPIAKLSVGKSPDSRIATWTLQK